jgi:hypothetical protein
MPTDVAVALKRKAEMEARCRDDALLVVFLWALVGLVLTAVMFRFGFDLGIAKALATAG